MAAPVSRVRGFFLGKILQFTHLNRGFTTQICVNAEANFHQKLVKSHTWSYIQSSKPSRNCECRYFSSSQFSGKSNTSTSNVGRKKTFSTSLAVKYTEEEDSADVVKKINTDIAYMNTGRLFAVVYLQGKQRKVTVNDLVLMKYHLEADIGQKIILNKVLLVGSKDFTIVGRPVLSPNQVRIEAMVIEKTLSPVQISFLYKKRKNWKRTWLHKFQHTILRITDIQLAPTNEE